MPLYDALVVGAGPAGASAAYELAQRGSRVLILEATRLPRYKACGGAIPWKFFTTLPERAQRTLQVRTNQGLFIGPHQRTRLDINACALAGVMRDEFDYEFTLAAVDYGAELIDRNPVVAVEEGPDRVTVRTARGVFMGRYLVGADGAVGIVRRTCKLATGITAAPALEAEVVPAGTTIEENTLYIHLHLIRDGYAWVFPKRERQSVGILSFNRDRRRVKHKLAEWATLCGLSLAGHPIHGHPIPRWSHKTPLATKRVFLVGDAAGTVDPFGGEGIRHGVISGRIAAHFIDLALSTNTSPTDYTDALYEAIHQDFVYARRLAALVYGFPGLAFHLWVGSRTLNLGKVLYGELRFRDLFASAVRTLYHPRTYLRLLSRQRAGTGHPRDHGWPPT